jgi:peptide/nickel transport system substrate-binding protein
MKRSASRTAVALIGVAALTLAGCAGSPAGQDGHVGTGGVFIFGQTAGVTQLDPNTLSKLSETVLLSLLWNGLTKYGSDGSTQPDLATSWTSSADGLGWTFHLRGGVKYDSGRAFTADDAVRNIDRVLDPSVTSQTRTKISMITKATATDPNTLVLTLKSPSPQLPTALIDVKMTDVDNIAQINQTANGTGPYKLKQFVPNQSVDLVANPGYWGGKPKLSEIQIVRYPDITAAESALRSGTATVLWNPPATALKSLRSDGLEVLKAADTGGVDVFEVDNTSTPFNNVRARQALAYATDRQAMLTAGFGGGGTVNPTQAPVSPTSRFYDRSLPSYDFDLGKAKQLFAEAGVTSGSTLTYWTIADAYPELTTEGQILQQDLAKIGITLRIETNEQATYAAKFYPNGKSYPGLIVPNELSFGPAPNTFSADWFAKGGTCECNWAAPERYNTVDHQLDAAGDPATIASAYQTIQQIMNAQSPIVIIANSAPVTVAKGDVRGAWVQTDGTLHIEDASLTG